jgi:hypothetical protein
LVEKLTTNAADDTPAVFSYALGEKYRDATLRPYRRYLKPIFIVSLYKCGTSWLLNVLNAHPQIAAVEEIDIVRAVCQLAMDEKGSWIQGSIPQLASVEDRTHRVFDKSSWSTYYENRSWHGTNTSTRLKRGENIQTIVGTCSEIAPWIQNGKVYEFRLYAGAEHETLLARTKVTRSDEAILTASPNPIPAEAGLGATKIGWSTGDGSWAQVYVSVDGGPEKLFASGAEDFAEAPWIKNGRTYEFRLYSGTEHTRCLATIKVTRSNKMLPIVDRSRGTQSEEALLPVTLNQEPHSDEPFIMATPNPVPAGVGPGTTEISWSTKDYRGGQIYFSVDGGPEKLFADNAVGYRPRTLMDLPSEAVTTLYHRIKEADCPEDAMDAFLEAVSTGTEGMSYVALKAADQIEVFPLLKIWQPKAEKIAIIRDGRDAALSALHYTMLMRERDAPYRDREKNYWDLLGAWANRAHMGVELARRGELSIIRYEDLTRDFVGTLKALLAWLGLEYPDSTLTAIKAQTSFEAITGRPRGTEAKHLLRKGVVGEWIDALSAEDKTKAWGLAGEQLSALGYTQDGRCMPLSPSLRRI